MTTTAPDLLGQAITFRNVMSQPVGKFTEEEMDVQLCLIFEEFEEFLEAYRVAIYTPEDEQSRIHCLKELSDLIYVSFQFAAAAGWCLDEALDRVHKSNMSKLVDGKPLKREDGKVLKGPAYEPPYLDDLI